MQFTTSLFTIIVGLAAATIVSAVPYNVKRSEGQVFACDTWDFQGNCQSLPFTENTCQDLPDNFQDVISSVRPDKGCNCKMFANFVCNDNQGVLPVSAPGIAEMSEENDALSSCRCTTGRQ